MIGCSQSKYISLKDYPDKKVIGELKNKNKSAFYKLLVYQPSSDEGKISSIIFIQNKNGINYWVVKTDSIITNGKLNNSRIFSYREYLKTGATKQEDKLKFVPPLMNGIETENVIYEDVKQKFYFEYGKNVTGYSPDVRLEKYRKEWLEIIRSELQSNHIL
jgi:hypothetical protein